MSSFYLDILKDRLYTFGADSTERRSAQTALYEILNSLVRIASPILSFTCDEVWESMSEEGLKSVHLASWPKVEKKWENKALLEKWAQLMQVRSIVLKALEEKRASGLIGNSLEAEVELFIKNAKLHLLLTNYREVLPAIFIVSGVTLKKTDTLPKDLDSSSDELNMAVKVTKATGKKCQRCWNYSESVGSNSGHPEICNRCIKAIES